MLDGNSVLGNSMPLTSNNQEKKQLFNYVVCWLRKKINNIMLHSSRSTRRLYFTDLLQAKTCLKKNLSLGHILDVLLKFRKFQAQYSCEVYCYVKREISTTNHVVCNVLVLIALAASGFKSI